MKKRSAIDEAFELEEVKYILLNKCYYFPMSNQEYYKNYNRVKDTIYAGGDPEELAEHFYDCFLVDVDTYEYFNTKQPPQVKAHYIEKVTGYWYSPGQILPLLDKFKDVNKTIDYINSEHQKALQPITLPVIKSQSIINRVVQRPSFQSTGNKDLDGLLILRSNLSCLYGYIKAKADNIKANSADNTKVDNAIKKMQEDINRERKYRSEYEAKKRMIDRNLEKCKKRYKRAFIFTKKKRKEEYIEYIHIAYNNVGNYKNSIRDYERKIKTLNEKINVISRRKDINNKLMQNDLNDIQKAIREFESQQFCILKSDYQYVDYLIYLFNSHRATTLKEALNALDSAVRHNELMNAINQLSSQISQSLNRISNQIAQAAATINTNLSYINSNLTVINSSLGSLENTINVRADQIEARQLDTQHLIAEGNRIASMNYEATKSAASSLESIRTKMYY